MILRIFRHFNIIKIVTHLEVTLQNVKQPKSGQNSGHVRNSDFYGIQTTEILRIFGGGVHLALPIGGVIPERNILTPLPLFVETIPIEKDVASRNGNNEFYRETARSNLK